MFKKFLVLALCDHHAINITAVRVWGGAHFPLSVTSSGAAPRVNRRVSLLCVGRGY